MPAWMLLLLAGGQQVALPPSLSPGALQACAPTTIEAAEACLRASLSAEDLAVLQDRISARRFRPYMDCAIETAWHLRDRAAPMAKVMEGLLGMHSPGMAASMIISDLQARATGSSLRFDELREAFRTNPPPNVGPDDTTCPEALLREKHDAD